MGRAFAGDRFLSHLFRPVAALAAGVAVLETIATGWNRAGLACRFVFTQASVVQTNADVGHGEVNQW